MILQALVRYYEDLLQNGTLCAPGWVKEKISWGLQLADDGQPIMLHDLRTPQQRGKKTVLLPQELPVPDHATRSSNTDPHFLCDNSSYILGVDPKGKPERAAQRFAACRALHQDILQDTPGSAAAAVRAFFAAWQPDSAAESPVLQPHWNELIKGDNLVFLTSDGTFVLDDADIRAAWQRHNSAHDDAPPVRCLVTGQQAPLARTHPFIKGVKGAQPSGAAIVTFNEEAFCSYGHKQGANAPVGSYAASAYTQALNYLLKDSEHCQYLGDTAVVCWAQGGQPAYQDACMEMLFSHGGLTEAELLGLLEHLAHGNPVDWNGIALDPDTHFYLLGLAPNAARLSVRFFRQDTFGALAKNVQRHHNDLRIVRPAYEKWETIPLYFLLRETVNKKEKKPTPAPQLSGDVLRAVVDGTPYPATLLNGVMLRIRAEREITRGRAAILKAYYSRRPHPLCPKEVLTVELNQDCNALPYLLGRLFSVLEQIQQEALGSELNTTIKDRYFNSAMTHPVYVYPTLIKLAEKHLAKLSSGKQVYFSKQLTQLIGRLNSNFPTQLTLPEQGAFIIGYYHQTQQRYTKKTEE